MTILFNVRVNIVAESVMSSTKSLPWGPAMLEKPKSSSMSKPEGTEPSKRMEHTPTSTQIRYAVCGFLYSGFRLIIANH